MATLNKPLKEIRAVYNDKTITVYQAYNKEIAEPAIEAQTFVSPPFKMERMTWIKPSFLWMMYRSGWASKPGQEYILAIKILREGFEWALKNSCLSHFDKNIYSNYEEWKLKLKSSPVRIQWDPEKDIFLQPLPFKSIQIGLTGIAVEKFVSDWICQVDDITSYSKKIYHIIKEEKINQVKGLLPLEKPYPLPKNISSNINHSKPLL